MRKAIQIAATMYEAQTIMRDFLGEQYPALLKPAQARITKVMQETGKDELGAMTIYLQRIPGAQGDELTKGLLKAMLMAACVEMVEGTKEVTH